LSPTLCSTRILAVTGVAGVAGIASIVAWPSALLVVFAVQQFVNGLILGVTFGVLYQPTRSRRGTNSLEE
jgi:hypothetical protein